MSGAHDQERDPFKRRSIKGLFGQSMEKLEKLFSKRNNGEEPEMEDESDEPELKIDESGGDQAPQIANDDQLYEVDEKNPQSNGDYNERIISQETQSSLLPWSPFFKPAPDPRDESSTSNFAGNSNDLSYSQYEDDSYLDLLIDDNNLPGGVQGECSPQQEGQEQEVEQTLEEHVEQLAAVVKVENVHDSGETADSHNYADAYLPTSQESPDYEWKRRIFDEGSVTVNTSVLTTNTSVQHITETVDCEIQVGCGFKCLQDKEAQCTVLTNECMTQHENYTKDQQVQCESVTREVSTQCGAQMEDREAQSEAKVVVSTEMQTTIITEDKETQCEKETPATDIHSILNEIGPDLIHKIVIGVRLFTEQVWPAVLQVAQAATAPPSIFPQQQLLPSQPNAQQPQLPANPYVDTYIQTLMQYQQRQLQLQQNQAMSQQYSPQNLLPVPDQFNQWFNLNVPFFPQQPNAQPDFSMHQSEPLVSDPTLSGMSANDDVIDVELITDVPPTESRRGSETPHENITFMTAPEKPTETSEKPPESSLSETSEKNKSQTLEISSENMRQLSFSIGSSTTSGDTSEQHLAVPSSPINIESATNSQATSQQPTGSRTSSKTTETPITSRLRANPRERKRMRKESDKNDSDHEHPAASTSLSPPRKKKDSCKNGKSPIQPSTRPKRKALVKKTMTEMKKNQKGSNEKSRVQEESSTSNDEEEYEKPSTAPAISKNKKSTGKDVNKKASIPKELQCTLLDLIPKDNVRRKRAPKDFYRAQGKK